MAFKKLQAIIFTPVPQKKPSGYQEVHEIMKAGSLHLPGTQLTAFGLLPAEGKTEDEFPSNQVQLKP